MIHLAYDGSLNGDWVARYAIRLAAHGGGEELRLTHVDDGGVPAADLAQKIERLGRECRSQGVRLLPEVHPLGTDVFRTLLGAVPDGPETFVVCGTRIRSKKQAYLSGTVSEKLLACSRFRVLAVRVVQPGLLGNPASFLLPLPGDPGDIEAAWPFLRLFLPSVEDVVLLRALAVTPYQLRHLSPEGTQRLRARGLRRLREVAEDLRRRRGDAEFHLDSRAVVSDDPAGEILVHASKLKTHMVLLPAPRSQEGWISAALLERVLRETPCDAGIYGGP